MRHLVATCSLLLASGCHLTYATFDYREDAGTGTDAMPRDGGPDAQSPDGGSDSGPPDAGTSDGGPMDAGVDGGPPVEDCFDAIALGDEHTCAIRNDGSLWCWGANGSGRLGLGDETACAGTGSCSSPMRVGGETDWIAITAGGGHTCGIRSPGSLWCWGANILGQLGIGVGGPPRFSPAQVGTDTNWTQVVAGGSHSCGLRDDRSLWCWGWNGLEQVGSSSCGGSCSSPVRVGSAVNWIDIALGDEHTCGLRTDGSLWCWGNNNLGQLGVDTNPTAHDTPTQVGVSVDWMTMAAGAQHSCGIRADGSLWCWGSNGAGRLGLGGGATNRFAPEQVGTSTTWSAIALGGEHSCGLQGGLLHCWGSNSSGQLGLGDMSTRFVPARLEGTPWTVVDLGGHHTAGLRPGETYLWGDGADGQLGTGGASPEPLPAVVTCPEG